MDRRIKAFCFDKNLSYSRYADDLSFSSNQRISEEQIASLKQIISESGFTVNERKVYLCSRASRQTVTGITVNQKPNVSRKILKNTRAMLHDLKTNGIESATQKHLISTLHQPKSSSKSSSIASKASSISLEWYAAKTIKYILE